MATPLRDSLTNHEMQLLVKQLKAGRPWSAVRVSMPQVDPEALDRGFKAWAHKVAGVEEKKPAPPRPPPAAPKKNDPLE